jgi:predicted nucleotidyltransferase/HEPN domain-containing protein
MSLPSRTESAPLNEAVRRLVETLQPERIYLFGSRARGDASEESDYDLMVIGPDDGPPRREQERAAQRVLRGLGAPVHVMVRSSSGFERDRAVVASFAATVAREGRLLYGSPPPPRSVDPMDAEARKAQLTREWLASGESDLRMAQAALGASPPIVDGVVYHCQQAFEKALKGYLTWRDRAFRKTHELPELIDWCAGQDGAFEQLRESAEVVSPYSWQFRYPIQDAAGELVFLEATVEQAEEAVQLARQAVDFVLARLPEHARP